MAVGDSASAPGGACRSGDQILGKLHLTASKIRAMAGKTSDSSTAVVEAEELSWIQSNLDEVISMLQQQSPAPPLASESLAPMAGSLIGSGSSNFLSERLLRQNAELTGFVSRLTRRRATCATRPCGWRRSYGDTATPGSSPQTQMQNRKMLTGSRRPTGRTDLVVSGALLSQEREAWSRERARLEGALQLSQAQAARLKAEVRGTEALRDVSSGPEADNATLKRIYGKYLRSESFRKALVYQKKYLLLLLGGFQECEEATLALICRMGGRPAICGTDAAALHRPRGLSRFRSAVRVSIALSSVGKTHTIGVDGKDLLHPGGMEVYRERGGERGGGSSSSRGRSGPESPRSTMSMTPTHRLVILRPVALWSEEMRRLRRCVAVETGLKNKLRKVAFL
ncbi:hypothetical protein CRUP_019821, partial [Coryphaenoides rupestris]